jgi:hypothetical protein
MEAPDFLRPLLEQLPPDVQTFLNSGGWLLAVAVVVLALLLLVAVALRRLLARVRRRAPAEQPPVAEDLASYPTPPALWGPRRLTLYGLPVRLRLVVVAPLGLEAGHIVPEDVEGLLDRVVPGLGPCIRADRPRVRLWPTQLSYQGFTAAFRLLTLVPQTEREPSRWALLMGRVLIARRPIVLGLALLGDQEHTFGAIALEHPHQWMQALRITT